MKIASKLALAAALACPCLVSQFAAAQDLSKGNSAGDTGNSNQTAAVPVSPASEPAGPNTGALTFSGGADLVSAYYFRGYLQENSGFIVEPYFGVATTLVNADDFKIGFSISTWNSLHSEHTGSDGPGPDIWYENDIYVSLPISLGDFTVTPSYYLYQYPNGAFDSIQEGLLTVAYDDSKLWKDVMPSNIEGFKVAPYVTVAYELSDGNGSEDGYWEVGVAPTFTTSIGEYKLPLTFPIALGMSYKDYYLNRDGDNDFFGYLSVGVQTSIPLTFIDPKYGTYAIDVGGYYINLMSDSVETTNNDASNVFWGKVGFTFAY